MQSCVENMIRHGGMAYGIRKRKVSPKEGDRRHVTCLTYCLCRFSVPGQSVGGRDSKRVCGLSISEDASGVRNKF